MVDIVSAAAASSSSPLFIRRYQPSDAKELSMLLGMGAMEQLSVANQRAYSNPIALAVWLALASAMIQLAGWWPRYDVGLLGYLSPLPGFASTAVPLLFAIDWFNRPHFEKAVRQTLSADDITDIQSYYSSTKSPYSAFWVLVWEGRPIGYIAVDATHPDSDVGNAEDDDRLHPQNTPNVSPKQHISDKRTAPSSSPSSNSGTALIRRFHVDRLYRSTSIHHDLAKHAIQSLFDSSSSSSTSLPIQNVKVRVSSLEPHSEEMWQSLGFTRLAVEKGRGFVVGAEKVKTLGLTRERWEARAKA